MVRPILVNKTLAIPAGVTVSVKCRDVTVTGPFGTLFKSFKSSALDLRVENGKVTCEMWFGSRRHLACIRTCVTHIENMIIGVTRKYQYKMRLVYAHFPINVSIENDGRTVAIRNFLGEKFVRNVDVPVGITVTKSTDVKDEIVVTGASVEAVSQTAANIHGRALVRNKDIRKFLDGIYVSEKSNVIALE